MSRSFHPQEQFELLQRLPKEEKPEAEKAFWIERAKQRAGIATVAALVLEQLFTRADSTEDELIATILDSGEELALATYQLSIAKELIRTAVQRRNQLTAEEKKYSSPEAHLEAVSRVRAASRVERTNHVLTIHFKVPKETYIKLNRQSGERSGGFFQRSRPEYTFENGLTNHGRFIQVHEETHALYFLFSQTLKRRLGDPRQPHPNMRRMIKRIQHEGLERIVSEYAYEYAISASDYVKDEILAFTREALRTTQQTAGILLKPSDKEGLYDYFDHVIHHAKHEMLLSLPKEQALRAAQILEVRLREQQETLVKNGLYALRTLLTKHKFTPEMALFYLGDSPLEHWEKEVAILAEISY